MDEQPTIRVATEADAQAVAGLLRRAYRSVWSGEAPETTSSAAHKIRNSLTLVAETGAGIVGTVSLKDVGGGMAEMTRLAVEPRTRRLGIGRALAENAKRVAAHGGFSAICGYSLDSMTTAHRLYQAAGAHRIPANDMTLTNGQTVYFYAYTLTGNEVTA